MQPISLHSEIIRLTENHPVNR